MTTAFLRLAALFVCIALIILGVLVRDIHSAQGEHFNAGRVERQTLLRQNGEILTLLKEGQ